MQAQLHMHNGTFSKAVNQCLVFLVPLLTHKTRQEPVLVGWLGFNGTFITTGYMEDAEVLTLSFKELQRRVFCLNRLQPNTTEDTVFS